MTAPTIIRPLVLLVDDEPAVLQALSSLLASRVEPWFRLVSAESMHEALEVLDAEDDVDSPLALAISDEKMPGGAGTELLVRLRTRAGHAHGGRIIVTGYADLDSAKKAINDAEVDRYYAKPWDAEGELLPAVGGILMAFASKHGLKRVLVATVAEWQAARADALALRQEWWEYVSLMGMSAEDMQVDAPVFEDAADTSAVHFEVREWSDGGRLAVASARLNVSGAEATLERVAFLPGAASDACEELLLRTAQREALTRGAVRLIVQGSALREEFYAALGFTMPTAAAAPDIAAQAAVDWTCALTGMATDAWSRRHAKEHRQCSCAQTGCATRDYAEARRSYLCPLDLYEGRLPAGFPGGVNQGAR